MLSRLSWLLFITSSTLSAAYYLLAVRRRRNRRVEEPPLVDGCWPWGNAIEFTRDAVKLLHQLQQKHGDVFTIRLVNQYLTIVMDPHSYENFSRERKFDFDAIQKQVNWNVFQFILREPKKIIKETGRTVRGQELHSSLISFLRHLDKALDCITFPSMDQPSTNITDQCNEEWHTIGIRTFAAQTIFDAIFSTIFGRANQHPFDSALAYRSFQVFHQYFNYFWLGMPKVLFPAATKAVRKLLVMPDSGELLSRDDLSPYLRTAIELMLGHGQTESDIKGHNLVYLHVNYNTFRLAFWALCHIIQCQRATDSLLTEFQHVIDTNFDCKTNTAEISISVIDKLPILDSVVLETCRLSSGVFMIRYVTEDTRMMTSLGQQYLIRRGDRVAMYPPALHKDPGVFEDPLSFKFDRFVDATFRKQGRRIDHPVTAFGSLCPGKRYALLQLKLYLFTVFNRFHFSYPCGQAPAQYDLRYHGHEVLPPVCDVSLMYRVKTNHVRFKLIEKR